MHGNWKSPIKHKMLDTFVIYSLGGETRLLPLRQILLGQKHTKYIKLVCMCIHDRRQAGSWRCFIRTENSSRTNVWCNCWGFDNGLLGGKSSRCSRNAAVMPLFQNWLRWLCWLFLQRACISNRLIRFHHFFGGDSCKLFGFYGQVRNQSNLIKIVIIVKKTVESFGWRFLTE